jgi:hypothetical protein
MKTRVQAQHLQPGDIVGSGEVVHSVIRSSIQWPSSKVCVRFVSKADPKLIGREPLWGKYTMINVERAEK